MALKYDMCVGRNKGHKVTKNISKSRPGNRKGVRSYIVTLEKIVYTMGQGTKKEYRK